MTEIERRQTRARDAQKAREAILNAAEEIFAAHGFDGARIDAITRASGYNTSLLFQYFSDKLGLYVAVLKRADQELNAFLESALSPWLSDDQAILDQDRLLSFLQTLVRATFDYLVEHPHLMRIITWEMAEGWSTYLQIAAQFPDSQSEQLDAVFRSAYDVGLLRSNFYPLVQLTLVLNLCQAYSASLPLYQTLLGGKDLSSPAVLAQAREYITGFVVAGMVNGPS